MSLNYVIYNLIWTVERGAKLAEFLIRIKARVTEGNWVHNIYWNELKIVINCELSKVRNFGNENVATLKYIFSIIVQQYATICSLSYVYWTVHHCDSWRIRDQLDGTSYYVLFHFFYAQHVSDINTSIIRSLRLFYWITTLVVCSCFDVCWSFGVAGLGWCPWIRLKLQHTSKQEHTTNVAIK